MSELIENLSDLVGRKSERLIIISDFFFVFSEQAVSNHKVFFSCVYLLLFRRSRVRARVRGNFVVMLPHFLPSQVPKLMSLNSIMYLVLW